MTDIQVEAPKTPRPKWLLNLLCLSAAVAVPVAVGTREFTLWNERKKAQGNVNQIQDPQQKEATQSMLGKLFNRNKQPDVWLQGEDLTRHSNLTADELLARIEEKSFDEAVRSTAKELTGKIKELSAKDILGEDDLFDLTLSARTYGSQAGRVMVFYYTSENWPEVGSYFYELLNRTKKLADGNKDKTGQDDPEMEKRYAYLDEVLTRAIERLTTNPEITFAKIQAQISAHR